MVAADQALGFIGGGGRGHTNAPFWHGLLLKLLAEFHGYEVGKYVWRLEVAGG